jgi:ketosteroid isomerase-like protein
MATPTHVEDRLALMDVMLKCAKGVDERDLDLYASAFTDDVEAVGLGPDVHRGRDSWISYITQVLSAYGPTHHLLGPQLATIEGDTAHCRTDFQATHFFKDEPEKTLTLWATYNAEMKRVNGEWKIARLELEPRGRRIQNGGTP